MDTPSECSSGSNGSSSTPPGSPNSQDSDPSTQATPLTRSQTVTNGPLDTNGYCTAGRPVESSFLQGETQINIGVEYQAHIPVCDPHQCLDDYVKDDDLEERQSVCVWTPQEDPNVISDEAVMRFCELAREKHRFSVEQSLGILQFANFDSDQAVKSLDEYRSIPEEWSKNDKVLFEQAFAFNGKMFRRIKQMLPDKSSADLVEYYYLWKKKRQRYTSFAEQAYKKRKAAWIEEMDELDLEQSQERENSVKRPKLDPCVNCKIPCAQLQPTEKGQLCGTCFLFWRRTGELRKLATKPLVNGGSPSVISEPNGPCSLDISKESSGQSGSDRPVLPPTDMALNIIDFIDCSLKPDSTAAQRQTLLMKLSADLEKMRREAQEAKTTIADLGYNVSVRNGLQRNLYSIVHLRREQAQSRGRITLKWAAYENLLAIQGFRRYGKDFAAIAEVIGSKTEGHVRNFYHNYKNQYKLDELIDQFETEKASASGKQNGIPPTIDLD